MKYLQELVNELRQMILMMTGQGEKRRAEVVRTRRAEVVRKKE